MNGIKSNKDISRFIAEKGNQFTGTFYVTSGERCKIIGLQDGTFPDFGHHSPKEMGGIWTHPIKILDGFWLGINGVYPVAVGYETFPYKSVFTYHCDEIDMKRTQVAFDTVKGTVITYEILSQTDQELSMDFIANFDLLPVWFSDECGVVDGEDTAYFDSQNSIIVAKDTLNEWYSAIGCNFPIDSENVLIKRECISGFDTFGKGINSQIRFFLKVKAGVKSSINFFIAGSFTSEADVLSELLEIRSNYGKLIEEKVKRYHGINQQSHLETTDKDFDLMYEWVKYNTDWLIQDCGKYGRGLSAGIPEYLWWFGCDNAYSVQGLLAIGEFELAKQTLLLLKNYSDMVNGNGKIVHEITTMGMVANPGNTQETGHFITAVYHYLRYTNDIRTVKELYEYCKKGIEWLLTIADEDGDLLPSGYGIIEIAGLNVELIDSAVYTCQALFCMNEMAILFDEYNSEYLENGKKLKDKINNWLWNEEMGLYSDAVGTPSQILSRIIAMTEQFEHDGWYNEDYRVYTEALKEKISKMDSNVETPFIINKNWVINTPMETLIAPHDKAIIALDNMNNADFVGEYGVYLDGFSNRNMMTISTGVQAVAEGRNGRSNHAYNLLKRINKSFSMTLPGSINEMSPDYGCFTQAWTVYAVAVPVLECFAGFKPMAHENKLAICPNIPTEIKHFSLHNIKVGDSLIDFDYVDGVYIIEVQGEIEVEFTIGDRTVKIPEVAHGVRRLQV